MKKQIFCKKAKKVFTFSLSFEIIKIAMTARTIVSAIAFISAFTISVVVTPRPQITPKTICTISGDIPSNPYTPSGRAISEKTTQEKITSLLSQDIQNGSERDRKIREVLSQGFSNDSEIYYVNVAAATKDYVQASRSISTEGLPKDFLRAWNKHLEAWERYSEFLNENVGNDMEETFSSSRAARYTREINLTWEKVLEIAKRNGARIPEGAYCCASQRKSVVDSIEEKVLRAFE